MPPVWLIIGAIAVSGIWMLADRILVLPRARRTIVGGKEVVIRRKRDVQTLNAVMFALYLLVFTAGAAIEKDALILVIGVVGFVFFGILSLRQIAREREVDPTEEQVRAIDEFNRRSWIAIAGVVIAEVVGALAVSIHHPAAWLFIAAQPVIWIFAGWHAWRLWQASLAARRA